MSWVLEAVGIARSDYLLRHEILLDSMSLGSESWQPPEINVFTETDDDPAK